MALPVYNAHLHSDSGGHVTSRLTLFLVLFLLIPAVPLLAEDNDQTIFCTFEDGNEVSIRYQAIDPNKKTDAPAGKPWGPGGAPMFLFTPTELTIGNSTIPTGAHSLFLVKNKNDWTLIVNKNVDKGASYDDKQDIVRVNMQSSRLPTSNKPFNLTLGHMAPKVCSIQVVYGDMAGWTEFKQK
jgi:Protein of unknown function (DUF2911)